MLVREFNKPVAHNCETIKAVGLRPIAESLTAD